MRDINQGFVDSQISFSLNGICHGQKVFKVDLKWLMHGKKLVKSIQDRVEKLKKHILSQILAERDKNLEQANKPQAQNPASDNKLN